MIEINCPNCGAPIDLTKDKCPYCETPYPKEIPLDGEEARHVLENCIPFGIANKNYEIIPEDCDITISENFVIKIPRIVSPETALAKMKFLTPNEHRAVHGLPPIGRKKRKRMSEEYLSKDLVLAILRDKDIEHKERAINRLPSANVKLVKRGNWVDKERHEHYPSGKPYTARYCGVCGKRDHNEDGDFCGYCGADMRGEKDE